MSTATRLPLDDPKWAQLSHAYGPAADIPVLLQKLADFPANNDHRDEPWYTLWSSLCHQGDVYSASFAAVPHIVDAATKDPHRATYNYFLLPACIEIARVKKNVPISTGLDSAYFQSLSDLLGLAAQKADQTWDEALTSSVLSAIAAAKGHAASAEIILELEGDAIPAVLTYLQNR